MTTLATTIASDDVTEAKKASGRPGKSILFVMLHDGLIRLYEPTLRLLEQRGHRVHIVYQDDRPKPSVVALRERLARECPGLTIATAPEPEDTAWGRVMWNARLLVDYLRYFDRRYEGADVLRRRVDEKLLPEWLRRSTWPLRRLGDPAVAVAIGLLRRLERVAEPGMPARKLIDELRPDLVLVTPLVDFGSQQPDYVKAARALGIPTALCVASWDNLTIKGHMRVMPDRIIVWNEAQRREAVDFHGAEPSDVVLTGAQNFDHWFGRRPSRDREAFCSEVGLDPERPFVLFLASSVWMVPGEVRFVEQWIRAIRSADDPALAGVGILVRPHPGSFIRYWTLDISQLENVAVWPSGRLGDTHAEYSEQQRSDLFDSLYYSFAAVGANTSALIEAGILGRPVCTLRVPDFQNAQGAIHFEHLAREDGGLLRIAESFDDHLLQLSGYLDGAGVAQERTRTFVRAFVRPHGLDKAAAPILADEIEATAELEVEPKGPALRHRTLRLLLTPVVALLAVALRPRPKDQPPLWLRLAGPLFWLRLRVAVVRARGVAFRHRMTRRMRPGAASERDAKR